MTLLNPDALTFLALVPLIVLLYLLKQRRRPAPVSTLMFWQRVAADRRPRAFFGRLPRPQHAYAPIPAACQPVRAGFYLVRGADGADHWLTVDTGDADQSALNDPTPPADAAVPAGRPVYESSPRGWWEAARVWPPWVYLTCPAFALCTLEWWGFHRRRTE